MKIVTLWDKYIYFFPEMVGRTYWISEGGEGETLLMSSFSRIKHPNLLPVHGVCTKRGSILLLSPLSSPLSFRYHLFFPFTTHIHCYHCGLHSKRITEGIHCARGKSTNKHAMHQHRLQYCYWHEPPHLPAQPRPSHPRQLQGVFGLLFFFFFFTFHGKFIYVFVQSNNILITRNLDVKITDFGQTNIKDLARTMTSISSVAWTGTPSSPHPPLSLSSLIPFLSTAPEILNGEPITTRCAVYSFGIILWELFSKKVPYDGEHPLKVVNKILSGFRPPIPECPAPIHSVIPPSLSLPLSPSLPLPPFSPSLSH